MYLAIILFSVMIFCRSVYGVFSCRKSFSDFQLYAKMTSLQWEKMRNRPWGIGVIPMLKRSPLSAAMMRSAAAIALLTAFPGLSVPPAKMMACIDIFLSDLYILASILILVYPIFIVGGAPRIN